MRDIFEKFPKSVLINFILRNGFCCFGRAKADLEADLLFLQWDVESRECQAEMDAACDEMKEASKLYPPASVAWLEAQQRWEKADRKYLRLDSIYRKYRELKGF
jgi:hypothetical protein